ncbi:MAG TPA: hypothetical protein DDZ39_12285 [Flavobacteriaceae bacterium]|nr:hypothetical protein [Flavobacteriaceae bacterium]
MKPCFNNDASDLTLPPDEAMELNNKFEKYGESIQDYLNKMKKCNLIGEILELHGIFKRIMRSNYNCKSKDIEQDNNDYSEENNSQFVKRNEMKEIINELVPIITNNIMEKLLEKNENLNNESKYNDRKLIEKNENKSKNNESKVFKNQESSVIIVHGENNQDDKNLGFTDEKWNDVVKKSLTTKLKNIPIKKTIKTKTGKVCVFVENNEKENVKEALKDSYNVEIDEIKKKKMYPKMKIYNLDNTLYDKNSGVQLIEDICFKNKKISDIIKTNKESKLECVTINEKNNYAVIKVSNDIRNIIKKSHNRIHLNLMTHYVNDSFHVIQCFKCQNFGHKIGSEKCSEKTSCFYCAEDHMSNECTNKQKVNDHKCRNCLDMNLEHTNHKSSSKLCPLFRKELETVMKYTDGITKEEILLKIEEMKNTEKKLTNKLA